MNLTVFDLDHTLLDGDSHQLWCQFLHDLGLADAGLAARNAELHAAYRAGSVDMRVFCDFYASTLRPLSESQWAPHRLRFFTDYVRPHIPQAALELVQQHQAAGDLVVMSSATNRFLTELTARHFGIEHLLATELECASGVFSGRTQGALNMRAGKVHRLHQWLQARGQTLADFSSRAYSDSINDLPLLEAVQQPVAVNPDAQLRAIALERQWPMLRLLCA